MMPIKVGKGLEPTKHSPASGWFLGPAKYSPASGADGNHPFAHAALDGVVVLKSKDRKTVVTFSKADTIIKEEQQELQPQLCYLEEKVRVIQGEL